MHLFGQRHTSHGESEVPRYLSQWRGGYAQLKRYLLRAVLKAPKMTESRMTEGILF